MSNSAHPRRRLPCMAAACLIVLALAAPLPEAGSTDLRSGTGCPPGRALPGADPAFDLDPAAPESAAGQFGVRRQAEPMKRLDRVQRLQELWFIQTSAKVKVPGDRVAQPNYDILGWYPASVPSTVLGALVQANVYADILTEDRLKEVPAEDFQVPWWYRTQFILEASPDAKSVRLQFDGINYRANVWLNGQRVASADEAFGAFRRFDFDVTGVAKPGDRNVLAVEVIPPQPGEPTIGFVDWNPTPPDRSLGLWREVRIVSSGPVSIEDPWVRTTLDTADFAEAGVTVSAVLRNHTGTAQTGTLEGAVEKLEFSRKVELGPKETRTVVFTPKEVAALRIRKPRVWWTHDLGEPELYPLVLAFRTKEGVSSATGTRFGIREVSDYTTADGHRGFRLNGREIFLRGAAWTDDILLDAGTRRLESQVLYARHANLNVLRLEGFWGVTEDLYHLCDQNGLLLLAGWSCQWEWPNLLGKPTDEYGGIRTPADMDLAARSWRDQILWLRNHPSVLAWLMASDLRPRPELETRYREILDEIDPGRPALISAAARTSELSGPSGVKMNGPYDYVPPIYWYKDARRGGAFGFSTETSPGPQIPPVESLRRMLPAEALWPIGEAWFYHCNRGRFTRLDRYNEAMEKRLGAPADLEDYGRKAQFLNYEGMRAMFEAYGAARGRATGVIQWMLNAAWPKLWWQLVDYYLMPNGAFYGAKKAGQPFHVLYDYGTGEVKGVNNTREPAKDLRARIRVFDMDLRERASREVEAALAAGEVRTLLSLADLEAPGPVYFLDLRLTDRKGLVDANFYALTASPDVLDEAAGDDFVTPTAKYADLSALAGLPPVTPAWKESFRKEGRSGRVIAELENSTDRLAFMIELRVVRSLSGASVLPVYWDDNYVTLLPGEKRRIEGFYFLDDLRGEEPELRVGGWNVR